MAGLAVVAWLSWLPDLGSCSAQRSLPGGPGGRCLAVVAAWLAKGSLALSCRYLAGLTAVAWLSWLPGWLRVV